MKNKVAKTLCELGVCDENSIEEYYPQVRDRDDIAVLKCNKSGVIFTSTTEHMDISHYSEKVEFPHYWKEVDRKRALIDSFEDDSRRQTQFLSLISNKKWMDVGTGAGGILDLLEPVAERAVAVEPQQRALDALKEESYEAYSDIADVPYDDFDVITLFHVFEHLTEPLELLKVAYDKLAVGGKLVVEVPHANDFLFSFLDLEEFKKFTFWSEHLVLHNRYSLNALLGEARFQNTVISGFQRYNLANHLHWLKEKKPGGHINWSMLATDQLDTAYSNMLEKVDMTDTIIAIAEK
ncbi:class I SAM-dependent methyltransferase [Halieaceae bacterium IMCC14734]|uniref:Class I SAM-dependent methyltransferase n=1 Tax=Candidatus Litorirhabdus singularis TaxID=2518993 RepID=A0ABT3TIF9_9GAMM|nr:class I SAM-dependent methyltransferase [Candidatus Litorirhabdus singularis]MCX2982118.1 class I SAM-dependent methyltransferase [Candidatus Litorirhabdus singularis]